MKLKNVLMVVSSIERSIAFYKELFGLDVILDNDENVILTEGLVLQDARIWKNSIQKDIIFQNNATELYFEEPDIESFVEKLKNYKEPIHYVNPLMEADWGQEVSSSPRGAAGRRVIRFYDPDGNLIEVGTPM